MTTYIVVLVLVGFFVVMSGILLADGDHGPVGFSLLVVAAILGMAVLANLTKPVSSEQLSFAQERCSSNAGLSEITNQSFVCTNGAEFTYESMTEMQDGK